MSNVLRARVLADTSDFNRKMNGVKLTSMSVSGTAKKAFLGITAATIGVGIAAVKTAGRLESMQKRMEFMFGKERGVELFAASMKSGAESVAEAEDIIRSMMTISSFTGVEQPFEFAEAIAMTAMQAKRDVSEVSVAIGRLFQKMDQGLTVGVRLRGVLGQAFGMEGKQLFDDIDAGLYTMESLRQKITEVGQSIKWNLDETLQASISKMRGQWIAFLNSLGIESLEEVKVIFAEVERVLKELAGSGVAQSLSQSFADILKNLTADDIEKALTGILKLMKLIADSAIFIGNNWSWLKYVVVGVLSAIAIAKTVLALKTLGLSKSILAETATLTANTAALAANTAAKIAAAAAPTGYGIPAASIHNLSRETWQTQASSYPGGSATPSKLGKIGKVAGGLGMAALVGTAGYKLGNYIGEVTGLNDKFGGIDPKGLGMPTDAERAKYNAERKNRKEAQRVVAINDQGENALA